MHPPPSPNTLSYSHRTFDKLRKDVRHDDMDKSIQGNSDLNPNSFVPTLCCT